MSKNITISEGSQAKNFNNVAKIRTNVIGGGTQNWVPEDEAGMYANLGVAEIDKNGIYKASDENLDGFSQVAVSVQPKTKTKTITKNGTYKASKDKVDGYSEVSVQVPTGGGELVTKNITENGTYNASDDNADGYSSVTVNVSGGGTLITKEITANGTYNASDDNASGYSSVTVNVKATHGRTIANGLNNAPVSSRISTADFFADLSEKAYEAGMSYYTSESDITWLENTIRTGQWARNITTTIFNYDNLVLVGAAGFTTINSILLFNIYVGIDGIMDESAEITISNIDEGMLFTEYTGNKFTAQKGSINGSYNRTHGGGTQGNNFDGVVKSDIDNNTVGSEEVVVKNTQWNYSDYLQSYPHTVVVTNLTGGTIA